MEEGTKPNTNLGELISTIYEQFLEQYGDEELASVATAAVILGHLNSSRRRDPSTDEPS